MATAILEPVRPMPLSPDVIAESRDLENIADDIAFWEDIRDRAFQVGLPTLGRTAAGLAEGHRAAWSRLNEERASH